MVQYATPPELASYLQQDLDASTANLALSIASELFAKRARTRFEVTSATYQVVGCGELSIILPKSPVVAVSAVRVNGVVVTGWTVVGDTLYRRVGFGSPVAFPPDVVEVDYTHGYATPPDDVKGVVLETAGTIYQHPDFAAQSESIDDYSVRVAADAGGFTLSPSARDLADYYAGVLAA